MIRHNGRSGRRKRSLSSSQQQQQQQQQQLSNRSPYFSNDSRPATKRRSGGADSGGDCLRLELGDDDDDDHDDENNGEDCTTRASPSEDWVATDNIPAHLMGNPYFGGFHDNDDGGGNGTNTSSNDSTKTPGVATNPIVLRRSRIPEDFSLSQAICSYGYFCLAPNRWVPAASASDIDDNDDDDERDPLEHFESDDKGFLVRPLTYVISHGNDANQRTTRAKSKTDTQTVLVAIGQGALEMTTTSTTTSTTTRSASGSTSFILVALQSFVEPEHHHQLTAQVDRMLRLDLNLERFHGLHPGARARGFGRLYRSPTLFEDMVKTITNCNMKWGGTVEMNAKLCRLVGTRGAFPTPDELYGVGADFLREHCRVGYRSEYIWNLAREIVERSLDLSRDLEGHVPLPNPRQERRRRRPREDVQKRLLRLKGIGPFAANNILQLMGYFDTHPYDTETVRLWKEEFGAAPRVSKAEVFAAARQHYARYEPYSFTAYWFDLWKNYERRAGARSPQWSIEQLEGERPAGVESDHNCVFANPPPPRFGDGTSASAGAKTKPPTLPAKTTSVSATKPRAASEPTPKTPLRRSTRVKRRSV